MQIWIAVALVFPGLGLELTLQRDAPGLFVRVVRAFLLSLAFWPLAIFVTRIPLVSLRVVAWGGIAAGLFLTARRARNLRDEAREFRDGAPAIAFVMLTILHLFPAFQWIVAPGNDMSMHTFMTRLIVEADRLPTSYEPIFPIHDFGSYAAGLPSIAAVLTTISGMPVERTTLVVALLSYPALVGGLSLIALRFVNAWPSLAAAWLVMATCEMHAYLLWGGNPTILSFALTFAAISIFVRPERGAQQRFFPFFAAGAGLVHLIPLIGMAYAFPLALVVWLVGVPKDERIALARSWIAPLAITVSLLALPYIFGARPAVSAHEIAWVKHWQRDTWHAYTGNWENFYATIWPYFYQHFSYGVVVMGASVLAQVFIRDRRQLAWAPFVVMVLLLVLNSRYWFLPASPALYPERMIALMIAPACALTAVTFAALARTTGAWPRFLRFGSLAIASALLLAWSTSRAVLAAQRAGERITVTAHDLAMMKWIEANLPHDAVIANNYGDAGAWIPALAFRSITHPHTNPFYFDEIDAWRMKVAPTFLFIGEHGAYDIQYQRDATLLFPRDYVKTHVEGDAYLFTIAKPRPASATDSWMGK
jgi:hypothetical protein